MGTNGYIQFTTLIFISNKIDDNDSNVKNNSIIKTKHKYPSLTVRASVNAFLFYTFVKTCAQLLHNSPIIVDTTTNNKA